MASFGVTRQPSRTALGVACGALLVTASACSTNPPPRPMPSPTPLTRAAEPSRENPPTAPERATPTQGRQAERRVARAEPAPQAPARAKGEPPAWYTDGVQTLGGLEHRAFAVTAADVRDARNRAMALAYEAYPDGAVAAHEAVRLADGSWRFFVLISKG